MFKCEDRVLENRFINLSSQASDISESTKNELNENIVSKTEDKCMASGLIFINTNRESIFITNRLIVNFPSKPRTLDFTLRTTFYRDNNYFDMCDNDFALSKKYCRPTIVYASI